MKKSSLSLSGFGSKIRSIFTFIFSGLIMIVGFIIATPFFLLSILFNWIKMSLGFALFWVIGSGIYNVVVLDNQQFKPFSDTSVLAIIVLGLIASIFVTIDNIKN